MTLTALLGAVLVKPALLMAITAAVVAALRRSTAAARHAVWAGAVVAVLFLPVLSLVVPPLRLAVPEVLRAGIVAGDAAPSPAGDGEAGNIIPGLGAELGASGGVGKGTAAGLPRGLFVLWVAGFLLLAGRRLGAEVRVRRVVRRARVMDHARLEQVFAGVGRSLGVNHPVALRLSDEVSSPAVTGGRCPTVLLPADANRWTESDVRAVAIHELGHIARGDLQLNLLADVAAMVYWCNPAVRLALRRMRAESEAACDDLVLGNGAEPAAYAQLLLGFARAARHQGASLPAAATAMARPRELESRLLAVLDARVPRRPLPRWVAGALAAVGIVLALPAAALTTGEAGPPTVATAGEPDRQGDSLTQPASERIPLSGIPFRVLETAAASLKGPDSALAAILVGALGRIPEDEADLVRERAAWALAQIREGRLIGPLLEALNAPDWRIRAYAAWALAPAQDPRALPHLIPMLRHPVWRLRAMAAHAVSQSGDARATEAMSDALADPAWQVRIEAVEYFARLGGPGREARLRPRLTDRHVAVRLAAARALQVP